MNSLQQNALYNWQKKNFDNSELDNMSREELYELINKLQMVLGMCEEVGEVSHHVLKGSQNIRGGKGGFNIPEIVDGVVDSNIYGTQLMSMFDQNVEQETQKVVEHVLGRDWKDNPDNGEVSHHSV